MTTPDAGVPVTQRAVPTIYLDVTDLILWIKQNATVTGIQRVHLNYALHAIGHNVKFIMFYGRACRQVGLVDDAVIRHLGRMVSGQVMPDPATLYRLCPNARLRAWSDYSAKYEGKPLKYAWHSFASATAFHVVQWLYGRRMPAPSFAPGDVLLNVGRSWTIGGYVPKLEALKRAHGLSAQLLLHDVIPVAHIQNPAASRIFTRFVQQSFRAFDRFFTSSDYNRREIESLMLEFTGALKPIDKSLFGQHINSPPADPVALPRGLQPGRYLLSVGRVIASKNQARLLQAWARVIDAGQDAGLQLVIVGTIDADYQALRDALDEWPTLRERTVFLGAISDSELDALYRGCKFTVFPSLIEGYGLPAAESISYGKFCLASNAASIPEVAGEHAGYFDPMDIDDMRAQLARFIQNEALLLEREALIRATPRISWAEATADLLDKARRPALR
ncbi:MAG: glycosyltransferase family 1 protein [Burkholderiales bacterium]|nr:MAG: glycosyltransferase family 1 protein [Burkholderiales bacterium]